MERGGTIAAATPCVGSAATTTWRVPPFSAGRACSYLDGTVIPVDGGIATTAWGTPRLRDGLTVRG
jgi:hypothetical protein